ncbi:hypothetical protein PR202_ga22956 [Eleusine coracana subsp. coracana]|uniref:DUF4220 domain-containing protein n=1 Tax=Eleusine coracana subsp. coracana TaxID=191504 RepID=A0AAV5D5I1_ELECO|nr:hypothetical protein QOZ80_1AG0015660 [Eleusine coracana subsp. coracana]GJN05335.1 hypothetical protein PR202_ga22956 [Eleusine coracana subsp. coracana]
MAPPPALSSDNLVKAGLIAAAVLSVLLVVLSTYGRRRCSHPAVRLLVLGASIIYLPLTSQTISSLLRKREYERSNISGNKSNPDDVKEIAREMWTLLLWFLLILIIKGNADMAAATGGATAALPASGDVSIDGQRISPSVGHLFQYPVLAYLILKCLPEVNWVDAPLDTIFIAFTALGLAKTLLKLAASYGASRSFALGKNARLIAGYMSSQLLDGDEGQEQVPRYIVMGERKEHVRKHPQGYRVKQDVLDNKFSSLVTLDRVWLMAKHGDSILAERRQLRDLCLSYSLFKILRRRLSGYPNLADSGSSQQSLEFVLRGMDSFGAGGAANSDRVFRVLVDELWFASDFYYSPVPLCILGGWCTVLNCLFSVLIMAGAMRVGLIYRDKGVVSTKKPYQYVTYSLLVVTVLVEMWEILSGLWSNWAKMALLGHYFRHESAWRRYSCIHAAISAFLRLRPARRWRDKMGQNSVLEPGRFRKRFGFLTEKLYGRAGLMRSVPVSEAVKDAVLRSLLSSHGRLSKGGAAARRFGGKLDWALYGSQKSDRSSTAELILMWHIGTRLFEMKSTTASTDMVVASHLSNYFAYLVAAAPELLPDCAAYTEERYKEVAKDVQAALGREADDDDRGDSTAERYERLVAALSATSRDTVLRRGAEIGRHLVKEYARDEASGSRILVEFWSEMLLYVAPSENIKGHVQAMARGGEFVTLVWALLFHAGITTRPETPGTAIV